MFTGIIEDTGKIIKIIPEKNIKKFEIESDKITSKLNPGDSISVSGVCLTVTSFNKRSFIVDVVEETLRKTNLGEIKTGDFVNLEPAVKADGRFNGHFVLGHVDGTAFLSSVQRKGDNYDIVINCDPGIMRFIVEKGSVCIEGISLTIAELFSDGFKVSIIPFTYENTILKNKNTGDKLNIETDILGKYIYKFSNIKSNGDLSIEMLKKYGF